MDEGIGFRYAPKRYALRAPLGLRSSRRPHPFREERKQQTETAFRKTQLQNLTHTTSNSPMASAFMLFVSPGPSGVHCDSPPGAIIHRLSTTASKSVFASRVKSPNGSSPVFLLEQVNGFQF